MKRGDLVLDNFDRTGILRSHAARPDRAWLDAQQDPAMRAHADATWWDVIVVTGGLVIVPEPLLRIQREATLDDAMEAVAGGNPAAVRDLVALFPGLRDRVRPPS